MRCLRLLVVISVVAPPLACIEYKAEPEDGKQSCAVGPKQCPDNYQCINQRCYKKGSGPSATGGTGGSGSSGIGGSTSAGTMTCTDAGMSCDKAGGAISVCCNNSQCKYAAGGSEFPCAGFDCQAAAQDAVDYCTGWSTGGAGGSKGGAGGGSSSSARIGGAITGGGAGSKASTISTSGGRTSTVTFIDGQASGPMSGYGWIALGPKTVLSDPTCGLSTIPITSSRPCSDKTNWNSLSALCISGQIPALPLSPSSDDFTNNWGVQIGLNAKVSTTGTLGQTFSTMAATVTGLPVGSFRLIVHRQGDGDARTYCYEGLVNGEFAPFRLFNTACWGGDPSTVYLLESEVPMLDRVGVQINSTSTAINISNMCLAGISLGY